MDGVADGRFTAAAVPGLPSIRFCAGVGVCGRDLVCVADTEPREGLDPDEEADLRDAAFALGSILREEPNGWHSAAVRRLSRALRVVFDAAPVPIISLDADGRVQSWNPAAGRMFGWWEEEVRGRPLPIVREKNKQEFQRLLHRVLNGEVLSGMEGVGQRKDGSRIPVQFSAAPFYEGESRIIGLAAVIADLTEWTRVADERRRADESGARLAAIVQGSQDAIISYGLDGTIQTWNPGAERLYGRPATLMIGASSASFLDEPQAREMEEILKALLAGDAVTTRETTRTTEDGVPIPILHTASPVRNASGEMVGIATIARDIRDLRKRENEIHIMNRHLHKLSGELLVSQDEERRRIARELHDSTAQLLAALTMNLSLMSNRPAIASDEAGRELVADSLALSDRCSQEVRSISYGLHPPLLDELGLASALRAYVEGYSRRSGIAVTMDLAADTGRLSSEIELTIFRIVQECLSNVHRHSGSPTASIRLTRAPEGIELRVADQGRGVPPGWFEDQGNLGVGIPGIRERASQLGGRMDLKSGPSGTTIQVILPMESR